jgi:hypothetical protein
VADYYSLVCSRYNAAVLMRQFVAYRETKKRSVKTFLFFD